MAIDQRKKIKRLGDDGCMALVCEIKFHSTGGSWCVAYEEGGLFKQTPKLFNFYRSTKFFTLMCAT